MPFTTVRLKIIAMAPGMALPGIGNAFFGMLFFACVFAGGRRTLLAGSVCRHRPCWLRPNQIVFPALATHALLHSCCSCFTYLSFVQQVWHSLSPHSAQQVCFCALSAAGVVATSMLYVQSLVQVSWL